MKHTHVTAWRNPHITGSVIYKPGSVILSPLQSFEQWFVMLRLFFWEDKSGFNNIEGFRDIKTCINENVTAVDGLAAAPLTSLEPSWTTFLVVLGAARLLAGVKP